MRNIGIVVLNYNNVHDTINCVRSIYKYCSINDFALCVVDNNSREDVSYAVGKELANFPDFWATRDISFKDNLPQLSYIFNGENKGYANGNNIGIHYYNHYDEIEYILILNNDVLFTMDILSPLAKYLSVHHDVAVASPLLYDKYGAIDYECARYEKNIWDILFRSTPLRHLSLLKKKVQRNKILKSHPEYLDKEVLNIHLPSGSCMMFRKDRLEEIGYFDPNTFLYFEEDIIWKKIKNHGLRSVMLPRISCIHLGACSTSLSSEKIITEAYFDSLKYFLKEYSGYPKILIYFIFSWIKFRNLLKKINI